MGGPASEALRGDGAKRKSVRKRLPIRGSRCVCSVEDLAALLGYSAGCCRCEVLEQPHKKEDDQCGHPHTEKINWISAIWLRGCQGSRPGRSGSESRPGWKAGRGAVAELLLAGLGQKAGRVGKRAGPE